MIKNTKT